jgi:hypothetical protein
MKASDLACCLLSRWYLAWLILPWIWRWYVPPKYQLTYSRLHGIISQKTVLFSCENLKSYIANFCFSSLAGMPVLLHCLCFPFFALSKIKGLSLFLQPKLWIQWKAYTFNSDYNCIHTGTAYVVWTDKRLLQTTQDIITEILFERPMNRGDSACSSCTIASS